MNNNHIYSKNDRLLKIFNFVLAISIIIVISTYFVGKFIMPQSDKTIALAVKTIAKNFSDRSQIVHSIWTSEHRKKLFMPKWVKMYDENAMNKLGLKSEKFIFIMSSTGWPKDIIGIENYKNECERLWIGLLAKELSISYETVKASRKIDENLCIYSLDEVSFSYNYEDGEIKFLE